MADDDRDLQLRKRQMAGLLLLVLLLLGITAVLRRAMLFPPGWWRW